MDRHHLAQRALIFAEYLSAGLPVELTEIVIADSDIQHQRTDWIVHCMETKTDAVVFGVMQEHHCLPFAIEVTVEVKSGDLYVVYSIVDLKLF